MESAKRGYMMTGRAEYLTPFAEQEEVVLATLTHAEAVSRRDAEQRELLLRLVETSRRKYAEMKEVLRLFQAGQSEPAMALMLTDLGEEMMREISDLTNLVDLFVSDTAISSVPDLSRMPDLFAVFLGQTNITSPPTCFGNLTSLYVLNAEDTDITSLPVGLGASPDLFQLQLRNTAVTGDITATLRRIRQTAPNVDIWFTTSGCPVVTDPVVRDWFD